MSEYNVDFADNLVDAARFVAQQGLDTIDANRTVLYLSQLACEVTLKAMLERAGQPVKQIKGRRHDLAALLVALGRCTVEEEIARGRLQRVPAARLRSVVLDRRYGNATIGTVLTAEEHGASRYPNQVRYGEGFRSFPPALWLKAAVAASAWARQHWDSIRI